MLLLLKNAKISKYSEILKPYWISFEQVEIGPGISR